MDGKTKPLPRTVCGGRGFVFPSISLDRRQPTSLRETTRSPARVGLRCLRVNPVVADLVEWEGGWTRGESIPYRFPVDHRRVRASPRGGAGGGACG